MTLLTQLIQNKARERVLSMSSDPGDTYRNRETAATKFEIGECQSSSCFKIFFSPKGN